MAFLLLHWSKRVSVSAGERLVKSASSIHVASVKLCTGSCPALVCRAREEAAGTGDMEMQGCDRVLGSGRGEGGRKRSTPTKYRPRRCFRPSQ